MIVLGGLTSYCVINWRTVACVRAFWEGVKKKILFFFFVYPGTDKIKTIKKEFTF